MRTIQEPARAVPVAGEVEVLVAGAGPAGVAAALSAARNGARTVLLEQFGEVGGISTSGLMSHWTGSTRGGLYEEILDRADDSGGAARQTINPERLKTAYLDLLEEAGVRLRLYTLVSSALVTAGSLRGVVTESKSGREAFLAQVCIDCTGDGDVAARAGAPYQLGRPSDGRMQPMTLMFKVAGVDTSRAVFPGGFEDNLSIPAGRIQDLAHEHLPQPAGHVLLYRTTLPGVVSCNMTNIIGVDGTNADDLTRAHAAARRQIEPIVAFLRAWVPGYEQCYVISSAAVIGVRETRHFEGEYTLTEDDILAARVFDDWAVSYAHFNFDVHNITGAGLDETGVQRHFPQARGYTIPYRCLLPRGVENLLLAGRSISGTHLAHSNFRVMPICVNLGQAAGTAAALSTAAGLSVRQVDVAGLQRRLLAQGMLDPRA
ncbi:MAG: FAD-dependent oxidoreductase [Fimbriimonadaceae bacterium]|nr:FAD-dependent oxidoreductase [Fimbriimonadaceae bacterium]